MTIHAIDLSLLFIITFLEGFLRKFTSLKLSLHNLKLAFLLFNFQLNVTDLSHKLCICSAFRRNLPLNLFVLLLISWFNRLEMLKFRNKAIYLQFQCLDFRFAIFELCLSLLDLLSFLLYAFFCISSFDCILVILKFTVLKQHCKILLLSCRIFTCNIHSFYLNQILSIYFPQIVQLVFFWLFRNL